MSREVTEPLSTTVKPVEVALTILTLLLLPPVAVGSITGAATCTTSVAAAGAGFGNPPVRLVSCAVQVPATVPWLNVTPTPPIVAETVTVQLRGVLPHATPPAGSGPPCQDVTAGFGTKLSAKPAVKLLGLAGDKLTETTCCCWGVAGKRN